MSILAVGTIGFDDIETPSGKHAGVLGGSVTYFALAASYFTDVRVVAVVGEDFTAEHEAVFHHRKVDIAGIERAPGKTFRWGGDYRGDLNHAVTTFTDLNVLADFAPKIPAAYQDSRFLFLANMPPATQIGVRKAMPEAWLTGADTMNFWINNTREELHQALKLEDVLLINDGEAKMIAGDSSLPRAAQKILAMGPRALVIKHGEYGATVFFREGAFGIGHHPFRAPALPLEEVHDPTGAGDSFAGGFMGYIASQGEINREVFKRAMFYGSVMGSFAVERFGTARLQELTREEIDSRFAIFRELTHLE